MAAFIPNQKLPAAQLNGALAAKANQSDLLTVAATAGAAVAGVNAIANGTAPDAGTLDGSEVVTLSRGAGMLAKTLGSVQTFFANTFAKSADLAAATTSAQGAALVGFLQAGTGAVARTTRDKLRNVIHVEDFGAIGNDASHDDALGIAAAIAFATASGGGTVEFDGTKTYYPSSPLTIDPILVSLEGNGCILDYKNQALVDLATLPELSHDVNFNNAAAWLAGTLTPRGTEWAIGSGQATRNPGVSQYADFGQQITSIQANQPCQFTVVVPTLNASGGQKYLLVSLETGVGGPGGNGVGYGDSASFRITAAGTYSFTLTAPPATPAGGAWLSFKSNNTVTITSASVKVMPPNYGLRIKAQAAQYGHGRNKVRGFRIQNTSGAAAPLQDGIFFDTPTVTYASRIALYDLEFRTGVNRPMVFGNRAYLIRGYNINAVGYSCAIQFLSGSQDAGENIAFFGGTFGASNGPCVLNGGAEFNFFGSSFDYSPQFYKGNGQAGFFGCHFETNLLGATSTQYPFDNQGGDVLLHGGYILITGDNLGNPTHNYMFNTAKFDSRFVLRDVSAYNWQTATGQLAGGPGRVVIESPLAGGQHQMPGIIKRDANHNIFGDDGSFESGSLKLDAWLTGGDQARSSKTQVLFGSGGSAGSGVLSVSSSYARTGTKSLKLIKNTVGSGSIVKALIAAPIRRNGNAGIEFWYLAPKNISAGTFTMYVQAFFAQTQGRDSYGVPTLATTQFFSEPDQTVKLDGSGSWTKVTMNTLSADGSIPMDGFAPEWADIMYMLVDITNAPAGFELYIDDVYGSAF